MSLTSRSSTSSMVEENYFRDGYWTKTISSMMNYLQDLQDHPEHILKAAKMEITPHNLELVSSDTMQEFLALCEIFLNETGTLSMDNLNELQNLIRNYVFVDKRLYNLCQTILNAVRKNVDVTKAFPNQENSEEED